MPMNDTASAATTAHDQARLLAEALPFMQRYENKTIVVKYGGHAMGDPKLGQAFARDIALLKQSGVNPIVVHGGGPQIGQMLARLGIKSEFKGGLRVTDRETVEIVEMVLAGSINKEIVALINAEGEWAIGLSGKDGNMVFAEKARKTVVDPDSNIEHVVDLGFVGEPVEIDRTLLDLLARSEMIPVIAPVAPGRDGQTYNINADTFAGAIAGALEATRLLFLTDVAGVLDRSGKLIEELTVAEARALIADGTISGGMIPKVETCIEAVDRGVAGVVILDGKTPHAVLLELFTPHGAGTLIQR
jgi:acetylglutamate kinase